MRKVIFLLIWRSKMSKKSRHFLKRSSSKRLIFTEKKREVLATYITCQMLSTSKGAYRLSELASQTAHFVNRIHLFEDLFLQVLEKDTCLRIDCELTKYELNTN